MFHYIQNIFQFYLPFIKCNLPGTEYTGYLKDAEINGLYPKKQNVSFSVFNLFPNTVTQMKIFNNLKAIKGRETGLWYTEQDSRIIHQVFSFPCTWGGVTRGQYLLLTERASPQNSDSYKDINLGQLQVREALLAKGYLLEFKAQGNSNRDPNTMIWLKGSQFKTFSNPLPES